MNPLITKFDQENHKGILVSLLIHLFIIHFFVITVPSKGVTHEPPITFLGAILDQVEFTNAGIIQKGGIPSWQTQPVRLQPFETGLSHTAGPQQKTVEIRDGIGPGQKIFIKPRMKAEDPDKALMKKNRQIKSLGIAPVPGRQPLRLEEKTL